VELDVAQIPAAEVYKLLVGSVLPRPIAFVSTLSTEGVANLAPFSFFNVVAPNPPVLHVSVGRRPSGRRKDTAENVAQTGELVINVVNEELAERMNLASGEWPPEVNEFGVAGLTPLPSVRVKPARVAESPIQMECRLERMISLGEGGRAWDVIFAQLVYCHVRDDLYDQGRVDTARLRPLGRLAGDNYSRTRDIFAMRRPVIAPGDTAPGPDLTTSRSPSEAGR
jgi:flavin reductase (DIM6/NTAB) family NADH-FMN oxidoreductase RutF